MKKQIEMCDECNEEPAIVRIKENDRYLCDDCLDDWRDAVIDELVEDINEKTSENIGKENYSPQTKSNISSNNHAVGEVYKSARTRNKTEDISQKKGDRKKNENKDKTN